MVAFSSFVFLAGIPSAFTSTVVNTGTGWALNWVGENPSVLGVCQGDCDNDASCPGNSVCVQRSNGLPAVVSGCSTGDSMSTARKDTDYCSNPGTGIVNIGTVNIGGAYALNWVGENPSVLGVCQGDCDNDASCPGNSVCVQRSNGLPAVVSGCSTGDSVSTARKDTDYCSNPGTGIVNTGIVNIAGTYALNWLGENPSVLGVCQGDCDNDASCPGNSVCVQRTNGLPAAVPGCSTGDSVSTARLDTDYCSNPSASTTDVTGYAMRNPGGALVFFCTFVFGSLFK